MLSRRSWFATVGSLAAGLFALPAQAVAGLFHRGRCQAPQPCCVPEQPCRPPDRAGTCSVTIGCPTTTSPATQVGTTFTVYGTAVANRYDYPYVQLTIRFDAGGNPAQSTPISINSNNCWSYQFQNLSNTGPAHIYGELFLGAGNVCSNSAGPIPITIVASGPDPCAATNPCP
jgi:hypothetical protein